MIDQLLGRVSRSLDRGKVTVFWLFWQFVGVCAGLLAVVALNFTCSSRLAALEAVVRQIVVSLHLQDFFLFGASSSVWDCRLIRRPTKDARS
jgi:hypothetical protein